jgi:hypothetical protein
MGAVIAVHANKPIENNIFFIFYALSTLEFTHFLRCSVRINIIILDVVGRLPYVEG